jgi:hypothetical protein
MKIACRNSNKIPHERLFEMKRKLYLISIVVEGLEQEGDNGKDGDSDDDDRNPDNNDGENFDEADDLDDLPDTMDTDKQAGSGAMFQTPSGKQSKQIGAKSVSCESRQFAQSASMSEDGMPRPIKGDQGVEQEREQQPVEALSLGFNLREGGVEKDLGVKAVSLQSQISGSMKRKGRVEGYNMEEMMTEIGAGEIEQWEISEKEQTPEKIAHWYKKTVQGEVDDNDIEQRSKWGNFMAMGTDPQVEGGANLLQIMEMTEELPGNARKSVEEKIVLDKEVIEQITIARSGGGQDLKGKKEVEE